MKKGYYIHYNARDTLGVSKKIDMQIKEFNKHYDVEEIILKIKNKSIIRNAFAVFPFISTDWDYSIAYNRVNEPDFLYIRQICPEYRAWKFLKYVTKRWPNCKIIVEIHSYPFWKVMLHNVRAVLVPKYYINYNFRFKNIIDRYVVFVNKSKIMGVRSIISMNGILVDEVQQVSPNKQDNIINLITVSVLCNTHGYERVLKGLRDYIKSGGKRKILFHIVGDGPEKQYYEKLVEDYGISDYVIFYGMKQGKELDEIYDKADLALSSFGFYKVGITTSSTLKVREYLAKGLPVVSGTYEDSLGIDSEYCLYFDNDDSTVNLDRIIEYYDGLYSQNSKYELSKKIREYAKRTVDMSVVMKPIFDYIEEKEK